MAVVQSTALRTVSQSELKIDYRTIHVDTLHSLAIIPCVYKSTNPNVTREENEVTSRAIVGRII
jgi:hypothetical protein